MTSQFFGLDCADHCACAPDVCNLFVGCSASRNVTDNDHPWRTTDYSEPKYSHFTSQKLINENFGGFFIVFGMLCLYSFVTTVIIIVMKIRRKQFDIVYRFQVGISPSDALSPSEEIGANQDSRKETEHNAKECAV